MITPLLRSISCFARRISGFCRSAVKIALSRVNWRPAVSDEDSVRLLVPEVDSLVPAGAPSARARTPAAVPKIHKFFRIKEMRSKDWMREGQRMDSTSARFLSLFDNTAAE